MRKPFWKSSHKCWYYHGPGGRTIRLDPDEQKAISLWQRFNAGSRLEDSSTFGTLADAWKNEHMACVPVATYKMLCNYIDNFLLAHADLPCLTVTKGMLYKWLSEPKAGQQRKDGTRGPAKSWAQSTKADAAGAVKRVYRWAHTEGKISRNPLANVKVPRGKPRVVLIDPDEHKRVITELRNRDDGKPLALYLIASRCGCRPRHIREVTLANVAPSFNAWVFSDHKTSGKTGKALVVHLPPCVATLTRILAESAKPNVPLFRNHLGTPWGKDTIARRLRRLRARLNISDHYIAYAYRHTFATDALLANIPLATVSALMGHTDTRMVSRVYGHLDQHNDHLQQAVASVASRRLS